jgi:TRAP transporter TAXI family solute receptor
MLVSVTMLYAKAAQKVQMGIVTGGLKGTYYQFGLNLEELVKRNGIDLSVQSSDGSVENIFAVFKRPNTQMGIVQSDVLAFVAKVETDPVLKQIAHKIKMIYPLYDEEVHLLGTNDIINFDDLEGKKVAIGQEGSGSFLTAKLLFEVSGIKPAKVVAIGAEQALSQLKSGVVDAMFYVAGYPVKLFTEQVSVDDKLALLPIVNEKVTDFYATTQIPAGTYAWQTEAVNSVAVKSVLVSFNFRMSNCENVGRFAQTMVNNIDWLKENGHPKWNSVDLDYPLKGWEQYDCVKKFQVGKTHTKEEVNPVLEAIKGIL